MIHEGDESPITVERLPVMEWMLEELVADGELRYLPRNPERLQDLPKVYDVPPDVDGEQRETLSAMLREYVEHQN